MAQHTGVRIPKAAGVNSVRPSRLARVARPATTSDAARFNPVGAPAISSRCQPAGNRRRVVARAASAPASTTAPPQRPPETPVPVEGVEVLQVARDVVLLRGTCRERLKYEIEYAQKQGTTDNCYLLRAPEGPALVLIDVPFKAYTDAFLAALRREADPSQITHVIITHFGPNRAPSLAALLTAALNGRAAGAPRLRLIVTNPGLQIIQSGLADKRDLLDAVEVVVVKSEEAVPITRDLSLLPVLTPTPRWPDQMCVYDPRSQLLFTSKLFSAHVAPVNVTEQDAASAFDVGAWEAYSPGWRYFFDCMLAPVARQASAALEKLPVTATPRAAALPGAAALASVVKSWNTFISEVTRGAKPSAAASAAPPLRPQLQAAALAPMHGPVVRSALNQLVREYSAWTEAQLAALQTSSVAVLYASAYGNTAAIAQAVSRGVTKGGVAVQTVNLELEPLEEVVRVVKEADGFAIGSPTLGGHMPTQVQLALGSILREPGSATKPCGVFGSFGWSGEAVDEMEGKLKDGGFPLAFAPIRVKFKPTAKDLITCEQSGRDLAVKVKRRIKARELGTTQSVAASLASSAQLAMGRVVGSLCVVAARDEDAVSAMLASWVSQASFNPPGLTVAVKKDRGMELMLSEGAAFALSLVPEGAERTVMRAMTKPFQPGADRLAALETMESEGSGCPVLKDANAYLDCKVTSRMEAGDHWVVYATVTGGKVLLDTAATSVHHRKVGNHY